MKEEILKIRAALTEAIQKKKRFKSQRFLCRGWCAFFVGTASTGKNTNWDRRFE